MVHDMIEMRSISEQPQVLPTELPELDIAGHLAEHLDIDHYDDRLRWRMAHMSKQQKRQVELIHKAMGDNDELEAYCVSHNLVLPYKGTKMELAITVINHITTPRESCRFIHGCVHDLLLQCGRRQGNRHACMLPRWMQEAKADSDRPKSSTARRFANKRSNRALRGKEERRATSDSESPSTVHCVDVGEAELDRSIARCQCKWCKWQQ